MPFSALMMHLTAYSAGEPPCDAAVSCATKMTPFEPDPILAVSRNRPWSIVWPTRLGMLLLCGMEQWDGVRGAAVARGEVRLDGRDGEVGMWVGTTRLKQSRGIGT